MKSPRSPTELGRIAEYCGPEHLARALRMFRRWEASAASEGCLTEAGLLRLVEAVYGVSLSTEEGRHPRFSVFVAAPSAEGHVKLATRFDPAVDLSVESLRRLAPSVPPGGHALSVTEVHGHLGAVGVMALHDARDFPKMGGPLVSFGLGLPGLVIEVQGPGQLRATENGLTWELRAGYIKPVYHYAVLSVVQDWFQLLALDLIRKFRSSEGDSENLRHQEELGDPALVFDSVWSTILATAVAEGHGGAFVILPDDDLTGLTLNYHAADLDLADEMFAFWSRCFDAARVETVAELEERAARWEAARRDMYSAARAIAHLANVDGCVVLDRRLNVIGFGAEILVTAEEVAHSSCNDADRQTLEPRGRVDMRQFGTRHRSAYRLCALRPGTLVFVVSQDRDLRVFYGHRDRVGQVCVWRSLGVWMASSQRY